MVFNSLWSLQLLHLKNNYWTFINLNMVKVCIIIYIYSSHININHKFNYLLNKSSQLHVDFNYTSPIWCWLYVFLITMLHIFLRGGGHTEYILPTSASFNILLIRISNQRKQLLINLLIWIKYIVQTIILHPWLKECRVSRTN